MEKVDEGASLEFKWLKKRGVGGKTKEVRFYESFIYDGMEYTLYDCVYMYKEGLQEPYIGKLTKIWENPDKTKKVKVHWFFRKEEISNWLGDTKTLENEILFASGEGVGLANISPLEAIAGLCNVVCISKDSRNPQPSDEELKAADFIFSRTFDVQSCTISDKMDAKIGGIEIKYIFNRKTSESISTLPETTSDKKEENQKTTTCSEEQRKISSPLTENAKGDFHDNDIHDVGSGEDSKKVNKKDSEMVETDKLQDRPLKKTKADDKKPTNKTDESKVKNSNKSKKSPRKSGKKSKGDKDNLHDRPLKKHKLDDIKPLEDKKVELEVAGDPEKLTEIPSKESKANTNPEASGTFGASEETRKGKKGKVLSESDNGKILEKVTSDSEGKTLKKTRAEGSFKIPENKKNNYVQKLSVDTNLGNGKELIVNSEGKSKSNLVSDSVGNNKEAKEEQSGDGKKKLATSKSPKASNLSIDGDKRNAYKEFVVGPKPNAEKSGWFRRLPWEERLKNAYDQETAILLYNVDSDYSSSEVEDIIWHAFTENCEAKILPRTAVSSPHYGQALILLKTKEATQRILAKLDEECLMLPNGRPLVGTICPPMSSKKNSKFFGHLAIDKCKNQNREMGEAVSTSHFSQPNTIEYDMAMEWCVLQTRSKKWWEMIHKQQGNELKKLKTKTVHK